MRRVVLICCSLLVSACFHDNASPFVHGAKNAPSLGGSTHVAAGAETDTTGTVGYGVSSGNAGGMDKQYGGGAVQPGGSAPTAAAPSATASQTRPPVATSTATTTR